MGAGCQGEETLTSAAGPGCCASGAGWGRAGCWAERKREGGSRAGLFTGPNGEKGERVGLSRFHGLDWAGFGLVSGFYFLVFFLLSFSQTNSNLIEFK